jgi:hypothetical protein
MTGEFDGRSTRRAPRYPISVPVRFRIGEDQWVDGMTVNICAQGMLIRTPLAPPMRTLLQLRVGLTGDLKSGVQVACSGRVVRTQPAPGEGAMLVAVTIEDFQLRSARKAALVEDRR